MNQKKSTSIVFLIFVFVLTSITSFGQINFTSSNLSNFNLANPTSLQFGPDGKLYVSQQNGTISILTIAKNATNSYSVTSTETILLVKQIPNHWDDGTLKPYNITTNSRQITGLYVTGTSNSPIIYVTSSDSEIGGGGAGDKNLCTNSGIISKLTKSGSTWQKIDLVRGLPRSEENHATNGMQLNETTQILYLAIGGITNAGSPSKLFGYTTEYALSGCILSIDLNAIEAMSVKGTNTAHPYKYDLPTLDDPTRANNADGTDINDPFGGNDGLNQAKIIPGGPVQVFITGLRNPYDLVLTKTPGKANRIYTIDNGANPNWGGFPDNEGPQGNVTNKYVIGEPGSVNPSGSDGVINNMDGIHKIDLTNYTPGSYYGGFPCPIRANPAGAGLYTNSGYSDTTGVWRNSKTDPKYPLPSDWPPVPVSMAHPVEGDFQNPGETNSALMTFDESTNGICEYTASYFGSALKGDLLVVSYNGVMTRVRTASDGSILNTKGTKKINQDPAFASGFGSNALDITTQGDNAVFPGTIWVANYGSASITVFEPQGITCGGTYSTTLDEDGDGYKNADEIDNGTNPCSAASKPNDNDGDFISDLNDSDDDNDGLPDTSDPFALDKNNGSNTNIPLTYNLFNNDPGTGFFGLGFTGLMTNKSSNYADLYNEQNIVAGGAIGAFTIVNTSAGDAQGNLNTQENAFQFGVKVTSSTPTFKVRGVLLGNFFNNATPSGLQSQGIYIGNGDQDNYLKVILNANGGNGGIQVMMENQGVVTSNQYNISKIPSNTVDLSIIVNPSTGKANIQVLLDGVAMTISNSFTLAGPLLQAVQGSSSLAVGVISTSRNGTPFNATWDLIEVVPNTVADSSNTNQWNYVTSSDNSVPVARHEDGFAKCGDKFYLLGGRQTYEKKPVGEYNPSTNTWKNKSIPPIELQHFQAVTYNNLIYIVCAFTGSFPNETPVPNIYIYNPTTDTWSVGDVIPTARRRGSAGVVVYNNKFYITGGIVNGHQSGFVSWFDEYNPATGEWKVLTDAPRARDHFQSAMIGTKLFLAGGRTTSGATNQVFNLTIPQVDVYDFATNTWSTNTHNIPTQRAGCSTIAIGNEIIVMGGESMTHVQAHSECEAMNATTGRWRKLDSLNTGRQATQAIVSDNKIYIAAGSGQRGNTPELNNMEVYNYSSSNIPSDPDNSNWTAIYNINAGGPTYTEYGVTWSGDTDASPSSYTNPSTSFSKTATYNFNGTNFTDAPNTLFNSNRWDGGSKGDPISKEMQWKFPVSGNGMYKIDLYFVETSAANGVPGKRVFDIMIEDTIRSNNFDIATKVPFNYALLQSYQIYVKDGSVDIIFLHEVNLPMISGITISKKSTQTTTPTTSAQVTPSSLDFGSVILNNSSTKQVTFKNTGTTNITISQVTIDGANASNYSEDFTSQTIVSPGASKIINVTFNSASIGQKTANLKITTLEIATPFTVTLTGTGTNNSTTGNWTALYYVNAGGTAVSNNGNNWTADTQDSPSAYTNQATSFSKTANYSFIGTNSTDAPSSIFTTYRWDAGVPGDALSKEMQWKFPVSGNGLYKIDLYFTEPSQSMATPGQRTFDIMIEDTVRASSFDISAEVAFNNTLKKSYQVFVKDGSLDLTFIHKINLPIVFGIVASKQSTTSTPTAKVNPTSLDYGALTVNTSATKQVTVTNTGGTNITISNATLEGTNASNFSEDFTTQTILSPGASKLINVIFTPSSVGQKTANLKITTLELSNAFNVALSGTGTTVSQPSSLVTITNPVDGSSFTKGASLVIQANASANNTPYLKINCPDAGWRKLKLGYDPNSIYTPTNNVVAGGNNKLEIVLKGVTTIDWSKIQIRPLGVQTNPIALSTYINSAENLSDGYQKITIPLSNFDASIDFTNLSHFEFPYSTAAGIFELNLQSMIFTGGSTPFVWFGNGKTNNKNDGQGGGGQLTAVLTQSTKTVTNVSFYQNNTFLGSDNASPYQYTWTNLQTGNYSLTAKADYSDGNNAVSNAVIITVTNSTAMKMAHPGDSPILYKVMANSNTFEDTSWAFDLPFVTSGNSTVTRSNQTISRGFSVPLEIPMEVFQAERFSSSDSLNYSFPVDKGGEVEVRLYFAETEFDQSDKRVMNVAIEDSVQLSKYDIYREEGNNTGVMKTYKTVSDGSVNINLIRIKHNPSIRAVEVVCLNDKCNTKNVKMAAAKNSKNQFNTAYPNPFIDKLSVNLSNSITERVLVRIQNNFGAVLKEQEVSLSQSSIVEMDLSGLATGIYFMQILSGDQVNETIKIIKR